ncbi:MAG: biotin--[acetyl-CoA-carboxylase] ligase [Dehalococcoidia bacterium]|nr:biotin--[acetyl-CoA-carboxylase] ligase [Dehalococcoidia bacterium]
MTRNIVSGMLRDGLYTRVVGKRIAYFRHISSTMDEAVRRAQEGVEEGTVVLAGRQTAGRGRFGRTWVSERGNLYLSIVLRPSLQVLQYLRLLSSVAVLRAIRNTTGLEPTIKWPNDLRLSGRKVCGILVENALQDNSVQYAIVGIGINVSIAPFASHGLVNAATSLNEAAAREIDLETLLKNLLHEMDSLYLPLRPHSSPALKQAGNGATDSTVLQPTLDRVVNEWRSHLETLGTHVEVRWHDDLYTGLAEDVDKMGNLILRQCDGTRVTLPAGEVTMSVKTGDVE